MALSGDRDEEFELMDPSICEILVPAVQTPTSLTDGVRREKEIFFGRG